MQPLYMASTPNRVSSLTMAIGCALAAVAGGLMGAIFQVQPFMGGFPMGKGIAVIILGGLGSIWGAVIGGLSSRWSDVSCLFRATHYCFNHRLCPRLFSFSSSSLKDFWAMSETGPKAPVVPMDGAGLPLGGDASRRAKRVLSGEAPQACL